LDERYAFVGPSIAPRGDKAARDAGGYLRAADAIQQFGHQRTEGKTGK
jgi:hypothetical protein